MLETVGESSKTASRPSFISKVKGPEGYLLYQLPEQDLQRMRELVVNHWLVGLSKTAPHLVSRFKELGLERYHELSNQLSHATAWPKLNRILPAQDVAEIRSMTFFKGLENAFGPIGISDEENVGWEEIYWRIVRPNETSDVGPIHADSWFWLVANDPSPADKVRVKIWIPLFCEVGLNGLKVSPGSHFKQYKFHGEYRDGRNKPMIEEPEESLGMQLLHTQPGQAVIFNDNLLHGGAINTGQKTRVSCEFTMFVDKDLYDRA